jgi:hypothetical protein
MKRKQIIGLRATDVPMDSADVIYKLEYVEAKMCATAIVVKSVVEELRVVDQG